MKNKSTFKQILAITVSLVLPLSSAGETANVTQVEPSLHELEGLHPDVDGSAAADSNSEIFTLNDPELTLDDPGLSSIILGGESGGAYCIDLNSVDKKFGELTSSDWKQWVPDFRYSLRDEHLSVEQFDETSGVIRQQFQPAHNGSPRVLMATNLPKHRAYRVKTSILLEPGWEWGGEVSQGGKLGFGLGGGSVPSGGTIDPSGFTARLSWRGARDGSGTAKLGIYSYAADRPKRYGEDNLFAIDARIGEWMDVIYEINLNSSTSVSDGSMRAWVDGKLVLDRQNVGWQLDGDTPVIDTMYFSSFYGGSTSDWSPSQTTYAKFREICLAPVVDGYSGIDPDAGRIVFPHRIQPLSSPGDGSITLLEDSD